MTANPHPENPLCRSPLRPDIYHKGEKQRILNIPGSELEDRQYQFNLTNIKIQTGELIFFNGQKTLAGLLLPLHNIFLSIFSEYTKLKLVNNNKQ